MPTNTIEEIKFRIELIFIIILRIKQGFSLINWVLRVKEG